MKKILFLTISVTIFGAIFFARENANALISEPPSRVCTEKELKDGQCANWPIAGKTYMFGPADYCRRDGAQNAPNALSLIEYKKEYAALDEAQKIEIDKLLAEPKYRIGGLVPCGRECDDPTTLVNEAAVCTFCHFFALFSNVVNWILKFIVTSLAVLLVVIGGFLLATSRGSPGQSKKGKDMLIWTFAGIAVIFGGWMVLNSLLSGIGVVKWTGLKADTGYLELYLAGHPPRLAAYGRTGKKDWEDDSWNGFTVTIKHADFKGSIERRVIDTRGGNILYIDQPLPVEYEGKTNIRYSVGGWWQLSCGT